MSNTLRPHGWKHTRLLYSTLSLKFMSIESMMLSHHILLCWPILLLPSIFLSIMSFPMSQLFTSGGQSIGVSVSASVIPANSQGWLVWSPCSPRNSLESSLAPQFKTINSSVLSLLCGPTLTNGLGLFKIMFLSIRWGPSLYFETYLEIVVNSTLVFEILLFGDAEVQKTWLPFLC